LLTVSRRTWAKWLLWLVGLAVAGSLAKSTIPVENRLVFHLLGENTVRRVDVEIRDDHGDVWRTAELFVPSPNPRSLSYVAALPRGEYQIATSYELLDVGQTDKNHRGGWTRKTVRHQIRLEGADHHFPPPNDEAK
jgi:hypothetical protein